MELIWTDSNGRELGYIQNANIDMEIGEDEKDSINDFEIEFARRNWNGELNSGSRIYVPRSEFGGVIKEIETDTKADTIKLRGYTWRGMMTKKVVQPDKEQDYFVVKGELNQIIKKMVEEAFPGLFYGVEISTGVSISYQFDRYCTLHEGFVKMLKTVNYRISIEYIQENGINGYVRVHAVPINDYSEDIELSEDENIQFTMNKSERGVNHLICLGKGELKDRIVLHLYTDEAGDISETPYYTGCDEIAEVYDSSGSERDDLMKTGKEKLESIKNKVEYDMTMEKMTSAVDVGDIVGGRDYVTGVAVKKPIGRKIWSVSAGKEKVQFKLKGET